MSPMMSIHPNEETLSRLADQSEVELMRSRAGRHVANCASCAAVITEWRTLGAAARAAAEREPSPELWARIDEARAHGGPFAALDGSDAEAVQEITDGSAIAPIESQRRWSAGTVRAAVFATAAAVVAAVFLWPSNSVRELSATALEHIELSPKYPAPGGTIHVRYVPGGATRSDTLWLEGSVALSTTAASKARPSATMVSSAPLVRTSATEYTGTLELPTNALAATVRVVNSLGQPAVRRSSLHELILTSGPQSDRPTLDAMERATELYRFGMARQQLAESFARWAPDHPMRWALYDDSRSATSMLDWVRRFTRTERAFARLDKNLSAQHVHRVFELVGMIDLAYALEDPVAARRWTDALVAEHPDDPRALAAKARALHQMELDGVPRDSIELLLPTLDTLYVRSGGLLIDPWGVSELIRLNGDSSTVRRWHIREVRHRAWLVESRDPTLLLEDGVLRDSAEAYAREVVQFSPVSRLVTGRYERVGAFTILGDVAYRRGDARTALAWTDSAERVMDGCPNPATHLRVLSLLALGDTLRAEDAIARRWWSDEASETEARNLLGRRFDALRWQNKLAAAKRDFRSCYVEKK